MKVARALHAESPVEIHTDGACSGNPGPGGWAAILRYKGHQREIFGWSALTTNNRMELLAAIRALEALKRPCACLIFTDSAYLRQGITSWIHTWKKNNWMRGKKLKEPVKNRDLWQRLDSLCSVHKVSFHWVKGHSGDPLNERCDYLARRAIELGQSGKIPEDIDGLLP